MLVETWIVIALLQSHTLRTLRRGKSGAVFMGAMVLFGKVSRKVEIVSFTDLNSKRFILRVYMFFMDTKLIQYVPKVILN